MALVSTAVFHQSPVWGSEASPIPARARIQWVDAGGNLLALDWKTTSEWVWDESNLQPPFFRLRIELPPDHTVQDSQAPELKLSREPGTGLLIMETRGSTAQGTLVVKFPDGTDQSLGYFLFPLSDTALLVHPSCEEEGIAPRESAKTGNGSFLYVAARCDSGDPSLVRVFHSSDLAWKSSSVDSAPSPQNGGVMLRIPRLEPSSDEPRELGSFVLKDARGENTITYVLSSDPIGSIGPWKATAGLSFTYLNYLQSHGQRMISVTQQNLTAKASVSYAWKPGWLDFGASGFATALPLGTSPSMPAARYYGLNFRASFQVGKWRGADWAVSPGWYYWGMSVADDYYGIRRVFGPQVLVVGSSKTSRNHAYSGYLKIAPIQYGFGLPSFKSRELAVGGSYQLTSPRARRPWSVTLDLADTLVYSQSGTAYVRVQSYSLGAQTSF